MTRAPLRLTLAAAVLAAVLALPPVSGPGILVIELPLLLAALCLIGGVARVVVTVALSLLAVQKIADLAMQQALGRSFNAMLRALDESRDRQARLVADAGHELRTPLTSLRTNLELLIAASRPGARAVPEEDMVDLRADVMAQIEELSTLVGDLVDLGYQRVVEIYVHSHVRKIAHT